MHRRSVMARFYLFVLLPFRAFQPVSGNQIIVQGNQRFQGRNGCNQPNVAARRRSRPLAPKAIGALAGEPGHCGMQ